MVLSTVIAVDWSHISNSISTEIFFFTANLRLLKEDALRRIQRVIAGKKQCRFESKIEKIDNLFALYDS